MKTAPVSQHHKGKRFFILLLSLVVLFINTSCSDESGAAKKAIIQKFGEYGLKVKSVTFIGTPERYDDSHRSPDDVGTTTKGEAKIEFSEGTIKQFTFQTFVAKKDGWTVVSLQQSGKQ